ncbi:MAG: Stp1/IreP family PP2C-type Ser/Thr phosphatase [Lachnospiraceae bacterium]|nr:Stp1/IreP family PP2C-type Ser/Thr phosphatase [Lachnospiraceae bacterium]MDE7436602.1 Stp1/IreP family PP2C-type Ser/Thr phosphatase [Lachnospiraceae bacterium]
MKTFSITDVGKRRSSNQDYVFSSEQPVGNLPNLFIVADGMGGHNAGEYASRYTVEMIEETIRSSTLTEPAAIIEEAVQRANRLLLEEAKENEARSGMGTTVVICCITGNVLVAANVGDSRLYVVNQDITQITKDHSLVEEMVRMGEMDEETARTHPDKHIITRAVGAGPDLTVDFFEVRLKEDDEILMCTDGLTNMVEDMDIRGIMLSQRDVAEQVEHLVSAANDNGGRDNITVVVIQPFTDEVKTC